MTEFSDLLRQLLDQTKLTNTAFAEATGTKQPTLSRVMGGFIPPPVGDVERWANGFTEKLGNQFDQRARDHFLRLGYREKAFAYADAEPYLRIIEGQLLETSALLLDMADMGSKAGMKIPAGLRERIARISEELKRVGASRG